MATSEKFYSGVIEGFYNRPWTLHNRLDLYKKMKKYKLNTYLYAPKDDLKHRSAWRQLYTQEECHRLKLLIEACSEEGVTFFYGISPGLDIVYSDPQERNCLLEKTKQIQKLGCKGFAILWDDIEPELSPKDSKHFDSFGHAHCKLSNELFLELGCPELLFCPVEYCSSRAHPNIKESEYLGSIGELLHPQILVFWTGGSVVSKTITVEEIQELSTVIKRKPVLWDNLHANDYDIQRVFLGPYIGRDRRVPPREYLSGSMTNPNCEYSLNLPALVTLADWIHNDEWDPSGVESQKLAAREMLAETQIPGPQSRLLGAEGTTSGQRKRKGESDDDLTEQDLELMSQAFWLPHSHGPRMARLLADFKYCTEHANIMTGWRDFEPGEQPDLVDEWTNRASYVNTTAKLLDSTIDKLTHIVNREIMFDLAPYLTNLRVILSGCNSYLKWIGLHECKKPIRAGPSLAGLPGGLAGDLMRLYPIQSESMFPHKSPVTPWSQPLLVLPFKCTEKSLQGLERTLTNTHINKYINSLGCASACLSLQIKSAGVSRLVGLIAAWRPCSLPAEKNKGELARVAEVFLSKQVRNQYPVLVQMFVEDPAKYLDASLLDGVLATLVEEGEGVVIANPRDSEYIGRFLVINGFKELKTSVDVSGCDLFCRRL